MNLKKKHSSAVSGYQNLLNKDQNQNLSMHTTDLMHDEKCATIGSIGSVREMKAYVGALNKYKSKMSAMVEELIKSVETSGKGNEESNILVRKKTSGIPSNAMECGIPLVVELPLIHDASHIINEAFREHLCRELTGNKRQSFDSPEFKEHLSLIEEIRRAEKDVMEAQERLLRTGVKGSANRIELNPRNVEKYSLLCPWTFVNGANEKKKGARDDEGPGSGQRPHGYGIHGHLRRLRLLLNKERPKLTIKYCTPEIERAFMWMEKPEETVSLSVNTNVVRFNCYVPGSVYKKTIVVTNSGKRLTTFRVAVVSRDEANRVFHYDYAPRGPLAAGMSARITVTFDCASAEDLYERIVVIAADGRKTYVLVCAENDAMPVLEYITEGYEMTTVGVRDESWSTLSSGICVFDCNACLVGGVKTVLITVKNIGRSAKFVIVPEDVWYTKSVEDIEWTRSMSLGAFKITPSIFDIKREQSISLSVTFEPQFPMFYCSRFIIMSDNSCANEVNVFGDGKTFSNGVWLEGQGLLQSSTVDGCYVLDMGKIGEVARYVYAKNTSRIQYSYRWIINHGVAGLGAKNSTVNLIIHPSTGTLDKNSRTAFRVECSLADNDYDDDDDETAGDRRAAKYHATATMMIDGIPKASIDGQDVFFEKQEDSSETLSIRVAEIDVISEHKDKEDVSLRAEPVILDLNQHRLWTNACAEGTVHLTVDGGSRPTVVSWVPAEDGGGARAEPERFAITIVGRQTRAVRVLVQPARTGRLRETLRFRAVDSDGVAAETTVYVRGAVDAEPAVAVRSAGVVATVAALAGRPQSHAVGLRLSAVGPFCVHRRLYDFDSGDDGGTWRLFDLGATSYGPYETAAGGGPVTLTFETPVDTRVMSATTTGEAANRVFCRLAEWWLTGPEDLRKAAMAAVAYTQSVTYVAQPDVRLNVDTVTIAEPLYKDVPYAYGGVRLVNNTPCELAYSWGRPIGRDADRVDCAFTPAYGTVDGVAFVEFQFIVTPKTSGHFDECYVPCFVQCDAIAPQQIRVRWRAEGFSATVSYADRLGGDGSLYSITWRDDENRWMVDDSTVDVNQTVSYYSETEDNPIISITSTSSDFDAVERRVTVRNPTGIPCRVAIRAGYFGRSEEWHDDVKSDRMKRCSVWVDPADNRTLDGRDELYVSVWALATAWGRYEDVVTIEIGTGDAALPTVRVPIFVTAVTFPVEFPLAADFRKPTVDLYSMDSEQRLQVMNNSGIPIQVSWQTYNKSEKKNRPFGAVYDTSTSDDPDRWSFRVDRFHGLESPRYFKIKPVVLKLSPREQGFVTFSLDRANEEFINRDGNNIARGKAIGTVTALEPPGKQCTRCDGFKLKPAVVRLYSETRHSIQPNLVLREVDKCFQITASRVYESKQPPYSSVIRWFTMLNLLRYPADVSFDVDSPFVVKTLKTVRCGTRPGNASIRVLYEDLVQIELQAKVVITKMIRPKMPTTLSARKTVQVGHLYAICEQGYHEPKEIASFEVHVRFPVLIPSTNRVNFGRVVVRESKSVDVTLSSYPGPERFTVRSRDAAFTVSPVEGVTTSPSPALVTITFRPKSDVRYSNKIEISTTIPKDTIFLEVIGFGIK